ncbi:MAG: hypothetical protein DRI70_02805 [Bacteroidetes bacterium]|nr:MAG: hypothetical protein DRI70_02805 [Bacteroidota bacterium]
MYSEQSLIDYQRIEKAIAYIQKHLQEQPNLDEIAAHVHLSPYHFQRLFTRWAGISPKKFMQFLTLQYARERLEKNPSLAEISQDAGLSGTGRLHDLFITMEGMTPDEYRRSGVGHTIYYGIHFCPFGQYLLAITENNMICTLQFFKEESMAIYDLQKHWFASSMEHAPEKTGLIASRLFQPDNDSPLSVLVRGTNFQLKVWEALLKIPYGEVVSYQSIAEHVNNPKGLQAVGSAIGKNPVAYLIPCHRVIKKTGQINEYRWGRLRKSAILGWESSSKLESESI